MLNPNRPIDLKLLICFLVFLGSEPITLKNRGRGGGGFLICSSFPNHDVKRVDKKENRNKKKKQGQTALERVRAQKSQYITIYMMHVMNAHVMHALMH